MKEKKIAYSVGEMAEYFGVSRDTLRLYDKMGILSPQKNEDNGYRVYSRVDFICLDYVMRLKSLGMPLEDIRMMINDCTIEKAEAIMQVQDRLIDEKIKELKSLQMMVRDYQKSFSNTIMQMGQITVEDSPLMIYKDIGVSMKDTMLAFQQLTKEQVPKFSFILGKEDFLNEKIDWLNPEARKSAMDYSMTLIDGELLSEQEGFPADKFEVLSPVKCVHTILRFYTDRDYSDLNRVRNYILENGYEVAGSIMLRTVSVRNNINLSVDYYDCWVPIK
ncbi:MAG: MerR family transcriptional regulator [Firmicutes bacterium]|nr:MerR family transcriptional regulator [Bacillota bacterium]